MSDTGSDDGTSPSASSQQHEHHDEITALNLPPNPTPSVINVEESDTATITTTFLANADLTDALRQRDEKIDSLERQKIKADEVITMLRSELGASRVKHKEECYWLQLEVDGLRRDREAAEDRMAELFRDMREIDALNDGGGNVGLDAGGGDAGGVEGSGPGSIGGKLSTSDNSNSSNPSGNVDSAYVVHLQSQLSKSMQTMGVLDNQIGMVKRSCDEVVRSLKEEIQDVMDDKCRVEMELMNQLAVLDNEKRRSEDEAEEAVRIRDERLEARDGTIGVLRKQVKELKTLAHQRGLEVEEERRRRKKKGAEGDEEKKGGNASAAVMAQLEKEKKNLIMEKKNVNRLTQEKKGLEEALNLSEKDLDSTQRQLELLKSQTESRETSFAAVVDAAAQDRAETVQILDKTAELWEKADESKESVQETIDFLQKQPSCQHNDGSEFPMSDKTRALSLLRTSSLVHGEIKASLLLVELRLWNQLTALKGKHRSADAPYIDPKSKQPIHPNNTPPSTASTVGPTIPSLTQQTTQIHDNTLASIQSVSETLSSQIQGLIDQDTASLSTLQTRLTKSATLLSQTQSQLSALQSRHDTALSKYSGLNKLFQELKEEHGLAKDHIDRLLKENGDLSVLKEKLQDDLDKAAKEVELEREKVKRTLENGDNHADHGEKKKDDQQSEHDTNNHQKQDEDEEDDDLQTSAITQQMFVKLQTEIFSVVSKLKEKNEVIVKLKNAVDEHKVREITLKKELKRIMKRVRAMEDGNSGGQGSNGEKKKKSALTGCG